MEGSFKTFKEFRLEHPEYDSVPDDILFDQIHREDYSDIPKEELAKAVDYHPPRSFGENVKELGHQIAGGYNVDLKRMIGQGLRAVSPEDSVANDIGVDLINEAYDSAKDYQYHDDSSGLIWNVLHKGGRALPQIAPALGASLINPALGVATVTSLYGPSSYQDSYDRVISSIGGTEKDAKEAGLISAAIDTAGELAATYFGGKIFGLGRPNLGSTTRSALDKLTDESLLKPWAKATAVNSVAQPTTEMTQEALKQYNEEQHGVTEKDYWPTIKESGEAGLGATLLLSTLGLHGHKLQSQRAEQLNTLIDIPDSYTPEQRSEVAAGLHADMKKNGIKDADDWLTGANIDIANKRPIRRDSTLTEADIGAAPTISDAVSAFSSSVNNQEEKRRAAINLAQGLPTQRDTTIEQARDKQKEARNKALDELLASRGAQPTAQEERTGMDNGTEKRLITDQRNDFKRLIAPPEQGALPSYPPDEIITFSDGSQSRASEIRRSLLEETGSEEIADAGVNTIIEKSKLRPVTLGDYNDILSRKSPIVLYSDTAELINKPKDRPYKNRPAQNERTGTEPSEATDQRNDFNSESSLAKSLLDDSIDNEVSAEDMPMANDYDELDKIQEIKNGLQETQKTTKKINETITPDKKVETTQQNKQRTDQDTSRAVKFVESAPVKTALKRKSILPSFNHITKREAINSLVKNGNVFKEDKNGPFVILDDGENYPISRVEYNYARHLESNDINDPIETTDKTQPIQGNKTVIATPKNSYKVKARYEVLDAGALITSHDNNLRLNAQFPQELQPRERTRAEYQTDLSDKVANLNPAMLGESATTDTGAPIVNKNNVVISGNGRSIALNLVHQANGEKSAQYKNWLIENADKLGLDNSAIEKIKSPVLVRKLVDDNVDLVDLARKSNEHSAKEMSVVEQAFSDANSIDDDTFSLYDGGKLTTNKSFLKAFINATGADNIYDADGMLSQKGVTRIEAAIMAKAYGNDTLVANLYEDNDTEIKSLLNALKLSASNHIKLRSVTALTNKPDLTQYLVDAVMLVKKSRQSKHQTVKSLTSQLDLISGETIHPLTEKFVKLFFYDNDMTRYISGEKVAEILNYVSTNIAKSLVNTDVFGENLTPQQILDAAHEQYIKSKQSDATGITGDIFNQVVTRGDERRTDERGQKTQGQGTDNKSVDDAGKERIKLSGATKDEEFTGSENTVESDANKESNDVSKKEIPSSIDENKKQNKKKKPLKSTTTVATKNQNTYESLSLSLKNALDKRFGNGWFDRLMATGKIEFVSLDEAQKLVDVDALFSSDYRNYLPKVRGGWTKQKIIRILKSSTIKNYGSKGIYKEIAKFDSAEDFKEHIFYHGTGSYIDGIMKPSITMSDRKIESIGGGGYGEKYWSFSLSKSKNIASNFTGSSSTGKVYPVILRKNANVVNMPSIQDAADIEDMIEDLWNKGIDAVWIGGGEQELSVLNPNAVFMYEHPERFRVYQKEKFDNLQDDEIKYIYKQSQKWVKNIADNRVLPKEERELANKDAPIFKFSKDGVPLAFYNPANDTAYFIYDNIDINTSDKDLSGLALHEIGVHALQLGKTNAEFQELLNKFKAMRKVSAKVKEAFASVPDDTNPDDVVEEALGYFIEHNPTASFTKRVIEAFRKLVRAIGKSLPFIQRKKFYDWANNLSETELQNMAIDALRQAPSDLMLDNKNRAAVSIGDVKSNESDIKFSIKSEAIEKVKNYDRNVVSLRDIDKILATGKMPQEQRSWKSMANKTVELFTDSSRPFDVRMQELPDKTMIGKLIFAKDREKRRAAWMEGEAMSKFIEPLSEEIKKISKSSGLSYRAAKELTGQWMTVRYALEKNQDYIRQDQDSVDKAKAELSKNPTDKSLKSALTKAKRKQQERLTAINEARIIDPTEEQLSAGLAGGYNDFTANHYMSEYEKKIGKQALDSAAKHVYNMLKWKLKYDLDNGKVTQDVVDEWHNSPHYVPLTGDPLADEMDDPLFSHGSVNQQSDKRAIGRSGSIAQNGIDAAIEQVQKSARYHGWVDFKDEFTNVYNDLINTELADGKNQKEAEKAVRDKWGISRTKETFMTRPSDYGLIIRKNNEAWVYDIGDKNAMDALRSVNKEDTPSLLHHVAMVTRFTAKAVTLWLPGFGFYNSIRDTWERSENIRTRALPGYESIDMNRVANRAIAIAGNPNTLNKLRKVIFNQQVDERDNDIVLIREMLSEGGSSTIGDFISQTSKDLSKQMEGSGSVGKKISDAVINWNNSFELVSSFSIFKALRESGVDKKIAASGTLNLMNFGKHGTLTGPLKALYMFVNPTMQGAHQTAMTLSTPRGRARFTAYVIAGAMLYSLLRGEDDDELGVNKMDNINRTSLERNIYIPIGDTYVKAPIGFGGVQLAWSIGANIVMAMSGSQSASDAAAEIFKSTARSIAPVAPSESSISKAPGTWIMQTFMPQIAKPIANVAMGVNAFGSPLTNARFQKEDKAKALQGRKSTAEEYKMIAEEMAKLGIDMYPEEVRELIRGYFPGIFYEGVKALIENPNKEKLGHTTTNVLVDRFVMNQDDKGLKERLYYRYRDEMKDAAIKADIGAKLDDREEILSRLNTSITKLENSAKGKLSAAGRDKKGKSLIYKKQADAIRNNAMGQVFNTYKKIGQY